jgi:hypothetical protein
LDIGAGAGKYGRFVREVVPGAYITAVEVWKDYITQFNLTAVYQEILTEDIRTFWRSRPDFNTEVVFIGDCIEHLSKSEGTDLIHYLMYRCKKLIIVFPEKYIQYSHEGNPHEAHISVWSKHDFASFKHEYFQSDFMRLVVIDGFIGDPEACGLKI